MHNSEVHWQSNRFSFLLGALLLYVLAAPLLQLAQWPALIQILAFMLFAGILISAVLATGRGPRWRSALILMAVGTAILNIAANVTGVAGFDIAFYVLTLIFLACIALLTIQRLMQSTRVSYETMAASICAYIVLILTWATAYSLLDTIAPGSFNFSAAPDDATQVMRFGFGDAMMSLYYSFVTMTTLGYGDITPAIGMARMLAALQAFVGQIYIAVLVARLVGLQIATASRSDQR